MPKGEVAVHAQKPEPIRVVVPLEPATQLPAPTRANTLITINVVYGKEGCMYLTTTSALRPVVIVDLLLNLIVSTEDIWHTSLLGL